MSQKLNTTAVNQTRSDNPVKSRTELYSDIDELMNVEEVASKLKVCTETVYRMIRAGRIQVVRIGRAIRITPQGYRQLLDIKHRDVR